MALQELLIELDNVRFNPRTLKLNYPENLSKKLSVYSKAFIEHAFERHQFTAVGLTDNSWTQDPELLEAFYRLNQEERTEILTFFTLFIHEFTHRVDFLISPFGLQFQMNTILEYWHLQKFIPQVLDLEETVDKARYLVAFGNNSLNNENEYSELRSMWQELEPIIHTLYAWGDVSTTGIRKSEIVVGWTGRPQVAGYPFGNDYMEPVTVLGNFQTFRLSPSTDTWYVRPLAIFETKAIVNSLLFILDLLKDSGPEECQQYFQRVYLGRNIPRDYFFLLNAGAQIYGFADFADLLNSKNYDALSFILRTLSGVCWYGLQAIPSPAARGEKQSSNPVLRVWYAFMYIRGLNEGEISDPGARSVAELLLQVDAWVQSKSIPYLGIEEVNVVCNHLISQLIERNQRNTWNPAMQNHFAHILKLMRPHFNNRKPTYVSPLGMPDNGNIFAECRHPDDHELTYEDYSTPNDVTDWFTMRGTLLFRSFPTHLNNFVQNLDAHFSAVYVVDFCQCGGLLRDWVSRFNRMPVIICKGCGQEKVIDLDSGITHRMTV